MQICGPAIAVAKAHAYYSTYEFNYPFHHDFTKHTGSNTTPIHNTVYDESPVKHTAKVQPAISSATPLQQFFDRAAFIYKPANVGYDPSAPLKYTGKFARASPVRGHVNNSYWTHGIGSQHAIHTHVKRSLQLPSSKSVSPEPVTTEPVTSEPITVKPVTEDNSISNNHRLMSLLWIGL